MRKWLLAFLGLILYPPWGAFLGFAVGWLLENQTRQAYQRSRRSAPHYRIYYDSQADHLHRIEEDYIPYQHRQAAIKDFITNTVTLMMAVARAGQTDSQKQKDILSAQIRIIRSFFENIVRLDAEYLLFVKEAIKNAQDHPLAVEAACRRINQRMPISEKLLLFEILLRIAKVDNFMSSAEGRVIQRIAILLGIPFLQDPHTRGATASREEQAAAQKNRLQECYETLGLCDADGQPEHASQEEIKKAYRDLAKKYHPDRVAHLGEEFKKIANEKFLAIKDAYETLLAQGIEK